MRMAIYTCDLTPENQHLMPWRMVLEIGRAGPPGRASDEGSLRPVVSDGERLGLRWLPGRRDCQALFGRGGGQPPADDSPREIRCLVLAGGMVGGSVAGGLTQEHRRPDRLVCPGACYLLRQAVRAVPDVGVRSALPFLIQSVYPKRHLVKRLRSSATSLMITASEFNRSAVCRAGWPAEDVFVVPPGKPTDRSSVKEDEPVVFNTTREQTCGATVLSVPGAAHGNPRDQTIAPCL